MKPLWAVVLWLSVPGALAGFRDWACRRWDSSQQTLNPIPQKRIAAYTNSTNCAAWLEEIGDTITYPYGTDETTCGAVALRDCLNKPEAAEKREAVKRIIIANPTVGFVIKVHKSLPETLSALPNLVELVWTCNAFDLPINTHIEELTGALPPQLSLTCLSPRRGGRPSFVDCSEPFALRTEYGEQVGLAYEVLTSCPNLRTVDIGVHQSSCVVSDGSFIFPWRPDDRLPSLSSLSLLNYDWNTEAAPGQTQADMWMHALDWGRLESLEIDLPPLTFLESFRGTLTGLHTFTLRPEWGYWGAEYTLCSLKEHANARRQSLEDFILALPPLKSLSIAGTGELLNLTAILQKHGASLETLRVHEFERDCAEVRSNHTWVRPTLSVLELEKIRDSCPRLDHLEIDVFRSGKSWPTGILKALASFPSLSSLAIHSDLEDPSRRLLKDCSLGISGTCFKNELRKPIVNATSATDLFHDLRLRSGNGLSEDSKLEYLTITIGDYEREAGGGDLLDDQLRKDWDPFRVECRVNGTESLCQQRS